MFKFIFWKGKVIKLNESNVEYLRSNLPFESFFDINESACESIKIKSKNDSTYCELTDRKFYKNKLTEVLITTTELWDYFVLNTIVCSLGIFTNTFCLVVFFHSKYHMPKMGKLFNY